ncbi:PepSY-associated TM helix domain-containing protein [Lysobacter capsici]|uniref:PepSY-associated TM helix domain-containing protein n=1 Tax=Lysobacter capsici TaxID=435897 RepID=UPI00287B93D1|nr:PepSY domain-containing protein [Lysobacter capsici]WND79924.1 PepSY domain-containing protein [Lysobacter capsici]WND85121.1 PepSY domain-containing protein [Lysobacter capsici]
MSEATTSERQQLGRASYRAVWRWHFYAGLFVAPLLLILAITGSIYLFNDEIEDAVHASLRFAPQREADLPLSRLIDAARRTHPGAVTRIDLPSDPRRTAQVFVTPARGEPLRVFVDPGTARVHGAFVYTRTLVGFADTMHGSLMLGRVGDAIVELAACWALLLIATGLYLWWPRERGWRRALWPDWHARGRVFWRGLHSSVGAWVAALIVFLILTGLPWAGVWGDLLRAGTQQLGIGYPAEHRHHGPAAPKPTATMAQAIGETPWTLRDAPMPASMHGHHMHDGASAARTDIGIDAVVRVLAAQGLRGDYRLSLPQSDDGVYTAVVYPNRPQGQYTVHIDRYSGAVVGRTGFADYGWAAQAVELGVQLHMGNYFGRANQIVMLLPCIGIVVLSISGVWMWWRRRPRGRLGTPSGPTPTQLRTIALIALGCGLLFPLLGASLLLVVAIDRWAIARIPWLATAIG